MSNPNRNRQNPNPNGIINPNAPLPAAPQAVPMARYAIKIKGFSGDTNPVKYLREFANVCQGNRWPQDLWPGYLITHLEDEAKKLYNNFIAERRLRYDGQVAPPITFEELSELLIRGFASLTDPLYHEEKLRQRKQRIGKSVEKYTYDLIDICNDVDPKMPEAVKVRWLIKNSRPNYIPQILILQPKIVQVFLSILRRIKQGNYLANKRTADILALEEQVTNLTLAITTLDNKVADTTQMATKETSSRSTPTPQRCFGCGRIGHVVAQCRSSGSSALSQQRWRQRDPSNENGCYTCGSIYHRTRACPKKDLKQPFRTIHQTSTHSTRDCRANQEQPFCTFHQTNTHNTRDCRAIQKSRTRGGYRPPPNGPNRSRYPPAFPTGPQYKSNDPTGPPQPPPQLIQGPTPPAN